MITGEMYAEFDHDVRGPLTVILGEVELVLSDGDVRPGAASQLRERGRGGAPG